MINLWQIFEHIKSTLDLFEIGRYNSNNDALELFWLILELITSGVWVRGWKNSIESKSSLFNLR